jgi:hypothetical protein
MEKGRGLAEAWVSMALFGTVTRALAVAFLVIFLVSNRKFHLVQGCKPLCGQDPVQLLGIGDGENEK